MERSQKFSFALLLLLMASSGCQMWHQAKLSTAPMATAEHPVVEIICVWQPGEGTGMDGLPTRGFAGQILFFAMGEKVPVRVDGKVRIYVFDDQGTEEEQQKPIHQFDFDSTAFQSFLTQTNLGTAYQLFIPYTRKGDMVANCTLRVRYSPDEGSSVYSKMATVTLPGTVARKPNQPVQDAATSDARMISDLLLTAGQTVQHEGPGQVTLADAVQEVSVQSNSEDKRRLRNTLTEIAKVSPATATLPDSGSGETEVQRSAPLKLHPLQEVSEPAPEKKVAEKTDATEVAEPAKAAESPQPAPASTHPLADD
ncbi:hypothetical protein SH661x_000799 [Planctomicrobium sp. SH661]|uniref:hypothetical protein n=1 Tax=Planctomicrobium sp. SH661 TaxID=3448124 RepID=UPI003F5C4851